MNTVNKEYTLSSAAAKDTAEIINLYNNTYEGSYTDPTFVSFNALLHEILKKNKKVYVARDPEDRVVACLSFLYDPINKIAKAGSAVVAKSAQGKNLTRFLIEYGIEDIQKNTKGISLLYITTRTVHRVAQHLTDKMGFKKLGIFPNAHKSTNYETHVLGGLYFDGLESRYTDFEQHPHIKPLFDIVKSECNLPDIPLSKKFEKKEFHTKVPTLEFILAQEFVKTNYKKAQENFEIDLGFFPFHEPTAMITSPGGSIQVYVSINKIDKHCVITGLKLDKDVSFTDLFLKVSSMLRDQGVRYIEMIVRAHRLNIIEKTIQAKFIPCGYVPGFQLSDGKRYDYAVFSRSFEILEFNDIELTGVSSLYLKEYIKAWSEISLDKYLKESL